MAVALVSSLPAHSSGPGLANKVVSAARAREKAKQDVDEFEGVEPSVRHLVQALRAAPPDYDLEVAPSATVIQVDFYPEEGQLGLMLDWSMAMPVIVQAVPGSPADARGLFSPGMVLIVVGQTRLHPGMLRDDVERLLEARPLSLFFEVPDTDRFAEVSTSLLALQLQAAATLANTLPGGMSQKPHSANASMMSSGMSWMQRTAIGTDGQLPLERSPLSRFAGRLFKGGLPPSTLQLPLLHVDPRGHSTGLVPSRSAPNMGLTGSSWGGSPKAPPSRSSSSPSPTSSPMPGRTQTQMYCSAGMSSRASGTCRESKPSKETCADGEVDPCYVHLVAMGSASQSSSHDDDLLDRHADGVPRLGPGHTMNWPLLHNDGYTCRLVDMVLGSRISEAYEKGYRASKRLNPIALRVSAVKLADNGQGPLGGRWGATHVVEEPVATISCDICGMELIGPNASQSLGIFYYCKQCKRNGQRFEMCPGCHACEVLQAEGKHCMNNELHPHYLTCSHTGLVRRKNLHAAHPQAPHLRRSMCDYCGKVAALREDNRKLYVCPTCPEEHGLRFEMCATCATDLLNRGWGIQRLRLLGCVV